MEEENIKISTISDICNKMFNFIEKDAGGKEQLDYIANLENIVRKEAKDWYI